MDSENGIVTAGTDILGTIRGVFGDYLTYQGLSKRIDSESARPWYVNDPGGSSYALGPQGQLYVRGAQAGVLGAPITTAATQILLLALLAGGAFLAFRAMR